MKRVMLFLMIALFTFIPINVFASNVVLCKYSNYKSNQDDNGTITISVDPETGKWTVQSVNNSTGWYGFNQTDNFDRVFSTAGVGKDIAITTEDYNALKNNGTCPSSAIRTNVGSYNIYFGSKATDIINNHSIRLGDAKAASNDFNWSSNASSADKETLQNYFTNGVQTIKDGTTNWVKKCNYNYTKNDVSGNVSIYQDEVNSQWKVVADKGQGKSQFDKEGNFDYVFSTQSTKDIMISTSDKTKLKSGACPEGALFNTGSGKNDVYIGEKARELEENKDTVKTDATAATGNFLTEEAYVAAHGSDNYEIVYDGSNHIGDNFCSQPEVMNAMRVLGYFIFIAKIFVPLIIIGFSVFDMYHAVLGGDEKSMGASAKKLGIRILIGICIFLVPSILNIILTATDKYDDIKSDSYVCQTCLLRPQDCENGIPGNSDDLFNGDIFVPSETYDTDSDASGEDNSDNSADESTDNSDEEIIVE